MLRRNRVHVLAGVVVTIHKFEHLPDFIEPEPEIAAPFDKQEPALVAWLVLPVAARGPRRSGMSPIRS